MIDILDKFKEATVLVLGDVMLDRYWWGSVSRVSPEAPVPVVRMESTSLSAGGAANVAANIAGLGATPILIGIMGNDPEGLLLPGVIEAARVSAAHLVVAPGRPTTVKTRVIAHNQQVARIDQESEQDLTEVTESEVLGKLAALMVDADIIVISDYAKGMLTDRLLSEIINSAKAKGIPAFVDPKGKDYTKYRGATLLTPNRREAADACGLEENDQSVVEIAGAKLLDQLELDSVLITQGEDGMTLFRASNDPFHLDTMARHVFDVTGAGDTVIATLAAAVGSGADLETAASIANVAAGIVIEEVGTSSIRAADLREALSRT